MSYEDIQAVTQITSMAIFASVLAVAVAYAFRNSNKQKFTAAAKAAIRDDDAPAAEAER